MELKRSYRRRGTLDLPISVYFDNASVAGKNPIPEYHPEIELVRVLSGHVVLQLGGVSRTFREGDIFLIPSNTVHCYRYFSEDARFCTVTFSADALAMQPEHFFHKTFVEPLFEGRLQLPLVIQPGHPAYEELCAQLDSLSDARMFTKHYQARRFAILINICVLLLPHCELSSQDAIAADSGNETIRKCMLYIHNRYAAKITLQGIANHCHLHPNYLCALFKAYTGQTLFDYLSQVRVETAAQLLKNEELPMAKISELVGFHSESMFYRKFKELMGTTPKAYAKAHRHN